MRERADEDREQDRVVKDGGPEDVWNLCPFQNIQAHLAQPLGLEIEDAPRARAAPDRAAIVNLARIYTDELSRPGFNVSSTAPGGVTT